MIKTISIYLEIILIIYDFSIIPSDYILEKDIYYLEQIVEEHLNLRKSIQIKENNKNRLS